MSKFLILFLSIIFYSNICFSGFDLNTNIIRKKIADSTISHSDHLFYIQPSGQAINVLVKFESISASSFEMTSQLEIIAERYDIGKIKNTKEPTGGQVNKPLIITTDTGKYVDKVVQIESDYDNIGLSVEEIIRRREHVYDFMNNAGFIKMPETVKTKDGNLFIKIDNDIHVLSKFIAGKTNQINDEKWLKYIAQYHNKIAELENPKEFVEISTIDKRLLTRYARFKSLYNQIANTDNANEFEETFKEQMPFIKSLVQSIKEALSEINETSLPHLLLHGDSGPWNIMTDTDGNPVGLIDNQFSYGPRIIELTKFRSDDTISIDLIIKRILFYEAESKVKLSDAELDSLKIFALLQMIEELIWRYEEYELKLKGKKVDWLNIDNLKLFFKLVEDLSGLDWQNMKHNIDQARKASSSAFQFNKKELGGITFEKSFNKIGSKQKIALIFRKNRLTNLIIIKVSK